MEKLFAKESTWYFIAVVFAILGIVCVSILLVLTVIGESDYCEVLKVFVIWSFGASAFSFGFCLTIRHTGSIEMQARASQKESEFKEKELIIRNQQLETDNSRHNFDRLKRIIQCLDGNTVVSLDAISELYIEAKKAYASGNHELVKRILLIFEFFIKKYSNNDNHPISYYDDNWDGRNTPIEPPIAIQTIIRMMFSRDSDNPFRNIKLIDLTHCNLQNIDFTGLLVENADFGNSALHSARMYSCADSQERISTEFTRCKFWHTYLQGANMSKSIFTNCDFTHSHLVWVNICESHFMECRFIHTDMTASLMTRAEFLNNVFVSTVMDAADIYGKDTNTPVLSVGNVYSSISLECAFIYPTGKVVDTHSSAVEGMRGCEHNRKLYDKPENRLSRLKRYSHEDYAISNKGASKYKFANKAERNQKLSSIYKKLLKYAHEDEYAGLRSAVFLRLWNELNGIYKSFGDENN